MNASPISSRPAHITDEGHEIVPNPWPLCSLGAPHEPSRNATLVPKASATMQNRSFGHEMSAGKPASGSIRFGSRHTVAYDAASPVGPTATHRQGRGQLMDFIGTKSDEE